MTDKTERERFEAAIQRRWSTERRTFDQYGDPGEYIEDPVNEMWDVWQARAALDTGTYDMNRYNEAVRIAKGIIIDGCGCDKNCIETGEVCGCQNDAMDIIYLGANLSIPEGWKLVPVEPTDEMVNEGLECASKAVYRRMIAAAPQPPASASAGKEPVGWFEDDVKRTAEAQARYEAESPRNVGNAGPVQPVAWVNKSHLDSILERSGKVYWHAPMMCGAWFKGAFPLYTAPTAHPDAYRQGAEEMREKCAIQAEEWAGFSVERQALATVIADAIRALPLPGDKEG